VKNFCEVIKRKDGIFLLYKIFQQQQKSALPGLLVGRAGFILRT